MGADLTPEERRKIYLEEKARSEARDRVAAEKKKKKQTQGCLGCLGLVILIFLGVQFCPSEPDVKLTRKPDVAKQPRQKELTTTDSSVSHVPQVNTKSSAEGVNCENWGELSFFTNADIADVNRCLQTGADPNARGERGSTPLARAVIEGNAETVVALLNAGADVNPLSVGSTPLHKAALFEKVEAVTILLEAGADPNARSGGGDTPLHRAAGSGNVEILMALLKAGAVVNVKGFEGLTPLMYAVAEPKRAKVMRVLLDVGADPNARASAGWSTLHNARYAEAVTALLEAGAFLEARDRLGSTPLHWVASRTSNDTVKALLDVGADLNARDNKGLTPLHWAGLGSKNDEVVSALLMAGADPYVRDNEGALAFDSSGLIKRFRERGVYRARRARRLAEQVEATTTTPGQGRRPAKIRPLLQSLLELQEAARQGSPTAADRLGQMYATGQEVPQDFIKAYAWTKVFILRSGNSKAAAERLYWLAGRMPVHDIQKAHEMADDLHRRGRSLH